MADCLGPGERQVWADGDGFDTEIGQAGGVIRPEELALSTEFSDFFGRPLAKARRRQRLRPEQFVRAANEPSRLRRGARESVASDDLAQPAAHFVSVRKREFPVVAWAVSFAG